MNTLLPDTLLKKAVNLQKIGVNSQAWELEDANNVLDWLSSNSTTTIILGGDFYTIDSEKHIVPTRENWYYEPTGSDNHQRSIEKAREALRAVSSPGQNILVDFVWS